MSLHADSSQNTPYRQDGDVVDPPVNIGDPSLGQRGMPGSFVPDVMEYDEVDNLVTEQNVTNLAASSTEETSNTEGSLVTEETLTTGSGLSTEEMPVERMTEETLDVDLAMEELSERRYPCREHKPPSRYDD